MHRRLRHGCTAAVQPQALNDVQTLFVRRPRAVPRQDSLYFANAAGLKDRLQRVELYGSLHAHPSSKPAQTAVRAFIIDCSRVLSIDARCGGAVDESGRSRACRTQ